MDIVGDECMTIESIGWMGQASAEEHDWKKFIILQQFLTVGKVRIGSRMINLDTSDSWLKVTRCDFENDIFWEMA